MRVDASPGHLEATHGACAAILKGMFSLTLATMLTPLTPVDLARQVYVSTAHFLFSMFIMMRISLAKGGIPNNRQLIADFIAARKSLLR